MSHQPTPAPATTQKSRRKAAAAVANDRAIFSRTAFGRRRIPPFPVRLTLGLVALVGVPFVVVYRSIRKAKRIH